MPKKKISSGIVDIGGGLAVIASDSKSKEYAEALPLVREIIEVVTNRNMESFDVEEILKVRPITLTLIQMISERKINLENWQEKENKRILGELQKIALLKLHEAGIVG